MTDEVNVTLSIRRTLGNALESSAWKDSPAADSYKLGTCETILGQILHSIQHRFGEEMLLTMMKNVGMNPVYRG